MRGIKQEVVTEVIREKEVFYNPNCITGDNDFLIARLKDAFKKAKVIDIIVAFLMESGVKLLENDLREAINRGVSIRILTGNYLNITQPQALYLLRDILGDKADIRFYNVPNKSFHPKAYIFHYDDGGEIFVGSSNISRSALTSGIEWNYRITKDNNSEDFIHFYNTFENLFLNHSLIIDEEEMRRYSQDWVRPKVYKDLEKLQEEAESNENKVISIFEPRGAQIEALYELNKSRDEGFDKGLVVAATGIGKTYLAAFDSKDFKRVLFVAHREEIIKQAARSFSNVRTDSNIGFFYGDSKDIEADLVFALVQTLGKQEYLNSKWFPKDYFQYVVIDEFHHAASGNYKNIIDYFEPEFLLGLTATPERLDNKDVFALCDYNIVYEVRLREAINKGLLVPFRYYGVYDEITDYDKIDFKNGKYDDVQLEKALMLDRRADLILKHYLKYSSKRAMGFCSSRNHAEYMAGYFSENGVSACAVYSGEMGSYGMDREEAINKLIKGEIKVIFSVDMFNEGLDIPSVDMVMFLRPTQSPTVFLQQFGRGLRKSRGKDYLNVLDFIGNYKKANSIPLLLSGKKNSNTSAIRNPHDLQYPEDCVIDFDFRLVDLFKKMSEKDKSAGAILLEEYFRIKDDLGHRPSRVELFTYMDDDVYDMIRKKPKYTPFNDYLRFLENIGELNDEEKSFKDSFAGVFINMVETTGMSKTYKMPILLAFYNHGKLKLKINDEDMYVSMRDFYSKGSNAIDMLQHKSTLNFKEWDESKYIKLAKDKPIKFLQKTHGDFFYTEGGYFLLNRELEAFKSSKIFIENFKDAIDLRTMQYYKNRFDNNGKDE